MEIYELIISDIERARELQNKNYFKKYRVANMIYIASPRLAPNLIIRLSHALNKIGMKPVAKVLSMINFIIFGLEVSLNTKIGGGLFFPHTQGIVIGAYSIGEMATIYSGVVIGARNLDFENSVDKRPTIKKNVVIGSGAVILGGIEIGNNVKIGANSIVISDIESGKTIVGKY